MILLIDANALKRRLIKARNESTGKHNNGWKFEWNGWNLAILQTEWEAVENQVDAIPISWLKEKLINHPEIPYVITDGINAVLDMWEEEKK